MTGRVFGVLGIAKVWAVWLVCKLIGAVPAYRGFGGGSACDIACGGDRVADSRWLIDALRKRSPSRIELREAVC